MASVHQSNLPLLDSSSAPPNVSDGTTRLYIYFLSPYAQRTWIARNLKGLDEIEVVAVDIFNKPSWYVEKVYSVGKVPALQHNGKVIGESLDILEYMDQNFKGPALYPQDSAKKDAVREVLAIPDVFITEVFRFGKKKEATKADVEQVYDPLLDKLETALGKFEDEGPYFVGQIGAADLAYAPLVERVELLLADLFNYDIYSGRPKLSKWFKAMNTVDAYSSTRCDPQVLVEMFKKITGR